MFDRSLLPAALCEFVVHLGDLVQVFPGGPDFDRAIDAAREQIDRSGLALRLVAGNHDVGDKPDPTSPADWVSPASLDAYQRRSGPSWYSWDLAGMHFVVVNSQILNADLPETAEQAAWLERDLAANAGRRIFLFLHLAPFPVDRPRIRRPTMVATRLRLAHFGARRALILPRRRGSPRAPR